ncbi:MAG: ATP-binding protein [Desulfosarcina sp.]|nr:ATP-binding protein [Desulfobacterales bacterium]
MNLDELIKIESERKPPRILLHSKHGLGKSSWASVSPAPIILQTEDGLTEIKVPHFPVAQTIEDVFSYIAMLIKEEHQYKTFILDTLDWFETLTWKKVCEDKDVNSIEEIGYAKGYTFAMEHHKKLLRGITKLHQTKNMAIILLAHNEVKTFNNPEGENYDQYVIKLHKKAAARYEEFCDAVFFMNHKAYIVAEKGSLKNKATGSGERAIYTEGRPAATAKCRYDLPYEIPFPKGTGFTEVLNLIQKSRITKGN